MQKDGVALKSRRPLRQQSLFYIAENKESRSR